MSDADPTRMDLPTVDETQVFSPVADEGPGGGYVPPTGGTPPAGPPPDRRPWIIAGLLALLVVVLILLLLAQGDDDNDDASNTSTTELTTSSSSTSTTTTTPSSTTTAAPTTTTSPVVTVPPATCAAAGGGSAKPGLAAETLYDAWVRGDQACAAQLTTPAALAELFSRDGSGANDQFQGCTEEDVPDPHTDCAFSFEGGATHYLMNFSDTDGWQTYDITQFAD